MSATFADAAVARPTLWASVRSHWGRARDARAGFETWSGCVQQLLGPTRTDATDWRALYDSGATPLEAARHALLGDRRGNGAGEL